MCLNIIWIWWKETIDFKLCLDTRVTVCSGCQSGWRNWLIFHLILYSSSRQPWLLFQQTLKVTLCSDMNGLRKESHSMLFLCLLSLQAIWLFMIAFCSLASAWLMIILAGETVHFGLLKKMLVAFSCSVKNYVHSSIQWRFKRSDATELTAHYHHIFGVQNWCGSDSKKAEDNILFSLWYGRSESMWINLSLSSYQLNRC